MCVCESERRGGECFLGRFVRIGSRRRFLFEFGRRLGDGGGGFLDGGESERVHWEGVLGFLIELGWAVDSGERGIMRCAERFCPGVGLL